ncbi:MAG: AAC(3) family N-acetyltransferase [Thermoproteota archaeon]
MASVTFNEILSGLKNLGIIEGDVVLVHSSLSSFGYVEGGAETVISALMKAVSNSGALLMPSFPSGSEYELARRGIIFDVATTPSEMGLITEVFRKRKDVRRSLSSTHSLAGWGKKSEKILENHEKCNVTCGPGSPFEKICQMGGKILLIGVDHTVNTTLHYVENVNGAPTLSSFQFDTYVIDYSKRKIKIPIYPHLPGLPRAYQRVEPILVENKIQLSTKIGSSIIRLIDAFKMNETIGSIIRRNPLFLIQPWQPWRAKK